jgi:hypothetical protein
LDWAARQGAMGVSELLAGILEDYSDWYLKEVMKSTHNAKDTFDLKKEK